MSDPDKTPAEGWRRRQLSISDAVGHERNRMMNGANRWDWKHGLYTVCGGAAVLVEALSSAQGHAVALAMHLTSGSLFVTSMVLGYITHSLTSPALPPVVVAVDAASASSVVTVIPSTPVQP